MDITPDSAARLARPLELIVMPFDKLGATVELARNIFISFVVAGKSTNEVFEQWEIDSPYRPRFGRNWWFWLPSLKSNGGRFRPHETTDISFHWFCYCISFTVFSWSGRV